MRTTVFRLLLVFASIFAVGALGFTLPKLGGSLTLSYLPSGIALAATYRFGRGVWPAVFLAGFAIDLSIPQPLPACIGVGAGLAGSAWLTAWLMERSGFDADFARSRDVPMFVLAVAVGMLLAPIFSLPGYYLSGLKSFAADPSHWVRWWANAMAGALLLGPMLLAYRRNSFDRFLAHWAEGGLWLLGLI